MKKRNKQSNCQIEPSFPNHETVLMSFKDPNLVIHLPSKRCNIIYPHNISICGEFE